VSELGEIQLMAELRFVLYADYVERQFKQCEVKESVRSYNLQLTASHNHVENAWVTADECY
jgi:hypothetical protein